MKLNRIITLCAMAAALALSVSDAFAQDNGGGQGGRVADDHDARGRVDVGAQWA